MYLIRNKDGSIRKEFTNEFVQQGSNNVNYIDFAIVDRDISERTADCYFELPNGEIVILAGTEQEFTSDNETFKGYRVYLSSAVLSYAGILKVIARIYDENGEILYVYPFEQMVNATTLDSTYDAPITISQYNSFMALLSTYINAYNSHLIRKYNTLENALSDISKITEGEHILISSGTNDYAMYYKAKSTDSDLKLVPNPTNWSEIYSYTGLSIEELSELSLTTLKDYIDKYDIKEINTNLLTGVLSTTLTLKDLSMLSSNVDFNTLYYTKSETYSKEESDAKFLSQSILDAYLTIAKANEEYLNKEDAKSLYLSKESVNDYETKADAESKHSLQDLAILNAQNKADSAYALASGKATTYVFDTFKDMKNALKSDDGTGFALGDTLNIREVNCPDYWISKKLEDNKGEFGYYEILENETDLSKYQTIEDNTLETTHKTIVGAINESKTNVDELKSSKQNANDTNLKTNAKTITSAINENKDNIDSVKNSKQDKEDNSLKTTSKNITNSINELYDKNSSQDTEINAKQSKEDVSLETENHNVVGAINEVLGKVNTNTSNISAVESKIPTKESELTHDMGYITKVVDDLENYMTTTAINSSLSLKANTSDIPTDNAQLTNGAKYIKKDVSNLENYYDKSSVDIKLTLKLDKASEKTKLSQLTNDSGFITKEINNLTYYYLKTEIDTKLNTKANTSDIPTKLSELTNDKNFVSNIDYASENVGGVVKATPASSLSSDYAPTYIINGKLYSKITTQPVVAFTIVDSLPDKGESNTIYLIVDSSGSGQDVYKEYIWIGNKWEKLGSEIDLSDYAKTTYVDNQISSVNAKFSNYYTSTIIDTKLSEKLDASKFISKTIIDTIGNNAVNMATKDSKGNTIDTTYATITALNNKLDSSKFTATNIVSTLGTNAVNRATSDKNGNDIVDTYALKTSLNSYLLSANFTATNIVSKLGTTAVNRATSDASGNVITSTYATKTELNAKLDASASAIVNQLGDTAVNKSTKAIQDENGNNIALTYQRSAFILNGSVSTNGTITFTDLTISNLINAVNNNQRIIFKPSDTSLASIDLNAQKTSDTSYVLKGSFTSNVNNKLTNYSCVITTTTTSASGTYTSQMADVDLTIPLVSNFENQNQPIVNFEDNLFFKTTQKDIPATKTSTKDVITKEQCFLELKGVGGSSVALTRSIGGSLSLDDVKNFFVENEDVSDSLGNHFVKLKKFYVLINEESDGTLTYRVANRKINDDYFLNPYFKDKDGNEIDFAYYGKYKGYVSNSKLCSKSGITPTYSTTGDNYRTYARNNSANYHQTDWCAVFTAQIMCMFAYNTTNSEKILTYRSYGSKTGSGTQILGIEDIVGNGYEFVDGVVFRSGSYLYSSSVSWSDKISDYASGITTNQTTLTGASGSSGNFISKMYYTKGKPALSIFPKTLSGSSSTYYCDYFYYNSSNSPNSTWWGASGSSSYFGLFYLYCYDSWSYSRSNSGSRLHSKELL